MSDATRNLTIKITADTKGAEGALGAINVVLKEMSGTSTQAAKATAVVGTATAKTADQTSQAVVSMKSLNAAVQGSIDLNRRMAYAYSIAGYQLKMVGDALSDMAGSIKDLFADYDFTLRRAAGALGILSDQLPAFKELDQSIKQTAVDVKLFSPEEIAKGYYYWGSTVGFVADEYSDFGQALRNQVVPIMQVAAVTQTDMESTLKSVYAVTEQFNIGLDSSTDAIEKMFYAAQMTALELPDLISSFKMVGPVAAANNVTFEQLIQTLGALGNAGIKGTMAGRALRQMFIQLDRPSAKAKSALDAAAKATFGLQASWDSLIWPEGEFVGLSEYLNVLTKMTLKMTNQQKQLFLATITTANELPAMQRLIQANTESLKQYGKSIYEVEGAVLNLGEAHEVTEKAVALLMDSLQAKLGEFSNRVSRLLLPIGKAMADFLVPILDVIGRKVEELGNLLENNPAIAGFIAQILLVGGAFISMAGSVLVSMGIFKLLIGSVLPEIVMNLGFVGAAAKLTGVNIAEFVAAGSKAAGLGRIFLGLSGSVAIVSGAVIALAGFIKGLATPENIDKLMKIFERLGGVVSKVVEYAGNLVGIIFSIGEKAGEILAGDFGNLLDALDTMFVVLKNIMQQAELTFTFFGVAVDKLVTKLGPLPDLLKLISDALDIKVGEGFDISSILGFFATLPFKISFLPLEMAQKVIGAVEEALFGAKPKIEQGLTDLFTRVPLYTKMPVIFQPQFSVDPSTIATVQAKIDDALAQADIDAGFRLGQSVSENIIAGLSSKQESIRQNMLDLSATIVDTWASGIVDESPKIFTAIKTMYDKFTGLMESENNRISTAAQAIVALIAGAISTGNETVISAALQDTLAVINKMLLSGKKGAKRSAFDLMTAAVDGLRGVDPSAATSRLVNWVIENLNAAAPAAQAAGYAVGAAYILELAGVIEKGSAALMSQLKGQENLLSRTPIVGGWAAAPYKKAFDERAAFYKSLLPDIDISTILPSGSGASPGGGGGGGGGGGEKQSPLEKALEVAKAGVDLAEALQKLKGVNLKALVKESMGPIQDAIVMADKIALKASKGISVKDLQKVAEFSDASQKVASLVGAAADAFIKLKDYVSPKTGMFRQLSRDVEIMLKEFDTVALRVNIKGLAAASAISDGATKVLAVLGTAFETFGKIKSVARINPEDYVNLSDNIIVAIDIFITSLKIAKEKMTEELSKEIGTFADSATKVVTLLGSAFDTFIKIKNYVQVPAEEFEKILVDIGTAVEAVINELKSQDWYQWNTEIENNFKAISAFADTATKVITLISTAWEAFRPKEDTTVGKPTTQLNMQIVMTMIDNIKTVILKLNTLLSGELKSVDMDALGKLAETGSKIAETIRAFFTLGEAGGANNIGALAIIISEGLVHIMRAILNFVEQFYVVGFDIMRQMIAGMAAQHGALQNEVAAINSILDKIVRDVRIGIKIQSAGLTGDLQRVLANANVGGKLEFVTTVNLNVHISSDGQMNYGALADESFANQVASSLGVSGGQR